MIAPQQIPAVARALNDNSSTILGAVGQLFGMGEPQRNTLSRSGVPWWVLVTVGATAGVIAGVKAQRRWPQQLTIIP